MARVRRRRPTYSAGGSRRTPGVRCGRVGHWQPVGDAERTGDTVSGEGSGADGALDLADAITLLRDQIAEAQHRISASGDSGVRFALGEITLELGLELARTRGVDGGLRFSVVSLGGKREGSSTSTHTVTVRLSPHLPGGVVGDVDVSDYEEA